MGQCVTCGSRGSVDLAISEFFDNMKFKSYTIEEFINKIKSKMSKGKIEEKRWVDLVDNDFAYDITGSYSENYHTYFREIHKDLEFNYLTLALMFLCQKDTTIMKQKISESLRILKIPHIIRKTEDERYTFIEKIALEKVLNYYFQLISFRAIKPVSESKNFDHGLTMEMNKNYSVEKINACAKDFVNKAINPIHTISRKNVSKEQKEFREKYIENYSLENKGEFLIKGLNKEGKTVDLNLQEFLDFDFFFQNFYEEIVEDKFIRELIYSKSLIGKSSVENHIGK
jgi:hypothetical protein